MVNSFSQMSVSVRKQYNDKLIGIMKKIEALCEENHITWFVAYGACIGAVRHKGMIPWDDDIDICIPRPEYERFLQICRTEDLGDYELATVNDMPGFYEHFARVYDKNSTLYFNKQLEHVGGIFVDVFPLDGAGKGEIKNNFKKFRFWQIVSHFSYLYYSKEQRRNLLRQLKFLNYLLVVFTTVFRRRVQKIGIGMIERTIRKYHYEDSKYVLFYNAVSGLKSMVPKEWVNETILAPFENIKVPIPKHYHEYLTQIYGDYMTPPPVEKRDDRHVFAYLDLEKRLTLYQIQKILAEE